jgi:hypothetical protein
LKIFRHSLFSSFFFRLDRRPATAQKGRPSDKRVSDELRMKEKEVGKHDTFTRDIFFEAAGLNFAAQRLWLYFHSSRSSAVLQVPRKAGRPPEQSGQLREEMHRKDSELCRLSWIPYSRVFIPLLCPRPPSCKS